MASGAAWASAILRRTCSASSIKSPNAPANASSTSPRQFRDGGCYHQYQPLTKKGNNDIGGGFNDDPLWLIASTAAYIKETGDFGILDAPALRLQSMTAERFWSTSKRASTTSSTTRDRTVCR